MKLLIAVMLSQAASAHADQARRIMEETGVKGGLVVHLGSGDGRLTAALRPGDGFVVHGLDADPANVEKARAHVRSLGLYGPVSVDLLKGTELPYVDDLANLVVADDLGGVPMREVMRILAPGGTARIGGRNTLKPRPNDTDEWTHFFYDAAGNPVSRDARVGPPRRLQWTNGPLWARHHDHMASVSAMVCAGGRVFTIMDEGPTASIRMPDRWSLTARDAYNGITLWKLPIATWWNPFYPLKSGPAQLTRRLVAACDRVYAPLGIDAPLSIIDAATGKIIETPEGTRSPEEILCADGILFVLANPAPRPVDYQEEDANCWIEQRRASARWGWDEKPRRLVALDAAGGRRLWEKETTVVPLTMAADGKRLVFHDGETVTAVDPRSGRIMWRSQPVTRSKTIPTGWSPRVILHEGVVLCSVQQRQLAALSAEDGKPLWKAKLHPTGHFCPEDIMVVDGLVWSGDTANAQPRSKGTFTGRDPRTGEVKREFPPDANPFACMHQRCYPSKATDRYIMTSWLGIEFIDPRAKTWEIHHWVRSGCIHGIVPANGMVYVTPHACACYYQSKLRGFNALAPAGGKPVPRDVPEEGRLQRGPAYGPAEGPPESPSDWPTYRRDPARSGMTRSEVPSTGLRRSWRTSIGGRLTAPTAAGGTLYVASVDSHTLHALDARDGSTRWTFTAGGRIDSPPTIHRGLVLFGSADGWIYALRAADGGLAWKFRAAPEDRRHAAFEQVESVWPLHGSVLVQDGVLFAVAGRSMFLDGGLRLLRLDPARGKKLSETVLDDKDPETGRNLQSLIRQKKMPVALPDILSSDGKMLYMRSQRFDMEGRRLTVAPEKETDQEGEGIHLFSPTGFLDDSWFHRSHWIYGRNAGEGWSEWFAPGRLVPTGRILVFDDRRVYGYGIDPEYLCNSSIFEYRLFAAGKTMVPERAGRLKKAKDDVVNWKTRAETLKPEELTAVDFHWIVPHPPLIVRAMVLAGGILFAAGPPDRVDEKATFGRTLDPAVREKLAAQDRALEGKEGGLLWAISAKDGSKIAELRLEAMPVFDGMIAAGGRLYMAAADGAVWCIEGR